MRIFLFVLLLSLATKVVQGQVQTGTSVLHFLKEAMVSSEIGKGKPTIVEFFGESCIVCFKMLPKLDTFSRMFGDRVSFVLLGNEHEQLPRTFSLYKQKYNLTLRLVCDSVVYKKFKPPYQPYFAWIDENGVVIGYSGPLMLNEKNVRNFLSKQYSFLLESNSSMTRSVISRESHRDNDVIFQTSFFKSKDSALYSSPFYLKIEPSNPQIKYINVRLRELCYLAWFGRVEWMRGEHEYEDTWPDVLIEGDKELDSILNERISYAMQFDRFRPTAMLQDYLMNDINRTFEINGSIEFREMPCWIVTRNDTSGQFLRSNVDFRRGTMRETYGGIYVYATPFREVLRLIESKTQAKLRLIDESGISWPIDMAFSAVMTDWDDVISALKKIGLTVRLGKRYMRVLVIRKNKR